MSAFAEIVRGEAPGEPCLQHDHRPRTLAQNRVIFGPSFGYEPTEADRKEAAFPWD